MPVALLALAAITLAGCASTPPPARQPDTVATLTTGPYTNAGASQQAHADPAGLAQWWQQFDDPQLGRLVQQALDHNTSLRIARATLREARATRAAAEAATRPQLGSSASASRSRASGTTSNAIRLGLDASWEPDLNGSQGAGVQAAEADEQTAAADLDATRVSIAAETALAYVQLRGAQARQRTTQASLASFTDTHELARWRSQAGLSSTLDLEQSRLNLEQTRASLPALATEIAQDLSQIALLTGQPLASVQAALMRPGDRADGGPAESPGNRPGNSPGEGPLAGNDAKSVESPAEIPLAEAAMARLAVGLPADLLRQRPDLRAAESAVRAQWLRLDQATRAGAPTVSLSGSLGLQALTVAGLSSPGAGLATLAAGIDWAVFDGGQRRAQVDQQDAALDRSQASYEAAVLTALKDVEDNLIALRGSQQRLASLQQAAEAADNALALTRHQHSAGLVDFATLLEAQRNALSARTSLQTTETDQSLNLIGLFKALGGGWPGPDADAVASAPSR